MSVGLCDPRSPSWASAKQAVESNDFDVTPLNRAEWMCRVGDGDYHRVTYAHTDDGPTTDCDCRGRLYHGRCRHVTLLFLLDYRDAVSVSNLDVPTEVEHTQLRRGDGL